MIYCKYITRRFLTGPLLSGSVLSGQLLSGLLLSGLLITALALTGCSSQPLKLTNTNPSVDIDTDLSLSLLPATLLQSSVSRNTSLSITQSINIEYQQQQQHFISVLEITPNSFKMVGLTPLGIKLFSIYSTGESYIIESSPLLDEQFNLLYLLADIQLTYWPSEQLNTQLIKSAASIIVNSTDNQISRRLIHNNKAIIDIQFSSDQLWKSDISFHHNSRQYTVHIKTLEIKPL